MIVLSVLIQDHSMYNSKSETETEWLTKKVRFDPVVPKWWVVLNTDVLFSTSAPVAEDITNSE